MNSADLITIDPDILGGTPVFKGTRVPVRTLFDYLENNYPLDEFLECFPSVTREMARAVLERSETALLAEEIVAGEAPGRRLAFAAEQGKVRQWSATANFPSLSFTSGNTRG